jgi:UDP-GlcNAc:undecaprenyl-phosphate/decaprenyl-phosphate GlcNAc-1-phosphate transferase
MIPAVWLGGTFILALCASLLITPMVIRGAGALHLFDAPDGVRRLHSSPVPRLGGVAVFLSTLGVSAGVMYATGLISPRLNAVQYYGPKLVYGVLIGAAILFVVGLADDVKGLPPSVKFLAQLVAAGIAYYAGIRLHSLTLGYGEGVRVGILSAPLIILWIVGVTNAYNFIDGLDGLAGGIAIVAAGTMLAVGAKLGNVAALVPVVALCGALFGFLRYNFPRARIFLGDAGSMSIGFLLAVLLLKAAEVPGPSVLVAVPILALCVPLLDGALAIIRRWLRGVPLSGADARHIHHRLLAMGLTAERTAIVLSCLAAGLAAFGLVIALTAPYVATSIAMAGLVGLSILIIYGTNLLSYDELIVAGEVLFTAPSRFRRVISDQLLANDLMARVENAQAIEEVLSLLSSTAPSFGFLRMRLIRNHDDVGTDDDDGISSWTWKLEYPLHPGPRDGTPASYKLAIWCSAENSVRPYGAERAAKIIAPGLERWLASCSSDGVVSRSSAAHAKDEAPEPLHGRRRGLWQIRAR